MDICLRPGGNILEKKRYAFTTVADLSALTPEQTVPYAYGDAGWKDKLTSFDGKPITHDAIGNPLTYDGWAYTWKAGRMLHSVVRGGENPVTAQFTYDHTGLRVKKTVNGVDTLYTLNGKKITHIRKGTNGATGAGAVQMHFFYDAQSRPMLVRYMDTDYAYLHSLQGDVTGIVDMNGVPVVEYGYDAWGKPVFTEGSMAETLGKDNPFRYRGYVWDEETGLYYLRSRYYDPCWGRFVNADTLLGKTGKLLSQNIYAYCENDPVNMIDSTGLEGVSFLTATDFAEAHGADGYVNTPARIRFSNGAVIEGHIRQTPTEYHFDFIADNKQDYRDAVDKIGDPYKALDYNPGVPIQFEVDYPDGSMKTWALVHNQDREREVCVWVLGSNGDLNEHRSTGRDNLEILLAPLAFRYSLLRTFVAIMGKAWRKTYYPDKGKMTKQMARKLGIR